MAAIRSVNSLNTIITYDNREVSQWSEMWSTTHIPGMDTATGGGMRRRSAGRRRLRIGSLALGALLTMHCRVTASVLTGGLFFFLMCLVVAVGALANPMRHFEVYLGQWSISGPGRAFRIIPMLDGIGMTIFITAVVRSINCCALAAIAALYVVHSVGDGQLPFTYCRDFDLNSYDPIMKDVRTVMLQETRNQMVADRFYDDSGHDTHDVWSTTRTTTVGLYHTAWRNLSKGGTTRYSKALEIPVCKETYSEGYPPMFSTPAYNFFYVEVVKFRENKLFGQINIPLMISMVLVWAVIWVLMVIERFRHGRLIWNNSYMWFVVIPWVWAGILSIASASSFATVHKPLKKVFRIGAKEAMAAIADALEVALYIHSVSVGTEMIHGKGLNHFASGHIDPLFNNENVWHSVLLLLITAFHSCCAALCALVDYIQPSGGGYNMRESTLWVIPMYSKCTSLGGYSHMISTLVFAGLTFSYTAVAFFLLKSALHTIFEYRVKLVFIEQIIVGIVILVCMGFSLLFATNGGIALLESVDAMMTGVAMPLVCVLELFGMLYVYRNRDFVSDMNVATEDNTCSSRISTQWMLIPYITIVTVILKALLLSYAEMSPTYMFLAMAPLALVVLAVPVRAGYNAYVFFYSTRNT